MSRREGWRLSNKEEKREERYKKICAKYRSYKCVCEFDEVEETISVMCGFHKAYFKSLTTENKRLRGFLKEWLSAHKKPNTYEIVGTHPETNHPLNAIGMISYKTKQALEE